VVPLPGVDRGHDRVVQHGLPLPGLLLHCRHVLLLHDFQQGQQRRHLRALTPAHCCPALSFLLNDR